MEAQTASTAKWTIDPSHSEMVFKVKHMMISTVTGRFEDFSGELEAEGEDFSHGRAKINIDVNSITTNNKDRDAHLKSDDFFNAESFPQITFVSRSFDGNKLVGDLTIRDVTKEVSLDVDYQGTAVDPYGQTKAGFEVRGEINRKDFNLKWNAVTEAGNIVVSDTVKLDLHVQFVKQ
ncbi:polyisoprenoid-binding protein [bacterium]|nr:polyisoprenoid-binding protein [bacterium]